MKLPRLTLCTVPLPLAGCLTLSSANWSAVNPWNRFDSPMQVTEQGVGALTGATSPDKKATADALDGDYRLRSGMKTDNGNVVCSYEAMKDDKLAIVISGSQGIISRIDILDHDTPSVVGVEIGTPSSDLYAKAFGNCQKVTGGDSAGVERKAEGSQHTSYIFSGEWGRPEDIMPSDDTPGAWEVSKIIWRH